MRKIILIILTIFLFSAKTFAQEQFSTYQFKPKEALMNQSSFQINYINPNSSNCAKNRYSQGFRGAGEMIVYTSKYGTRTHTNEFGTEAIVVDNVVTEISGADSLIPQNGYVISGHGASKKWMNENLIVGTKTEINPETKIITAYTTSDSYIYGAERQIKEVKYIVSRYIQTHNGYNVERTNLYILKAEKYIQKAKKSKIAVRRYSELAIEAANSALASAIPYKDGELRGVWIRPTFKKREQICKVLDTLASAGINTVFIETYYHGMTIFPSKTMEKRGFVKVNPEYQSFDALQFWIHEAHKRNMKVSVWFETFYIGNRNPSSNPQNIVSVNPSWANVTKKDYNQNKPTPSVSEHNGYFIDPANPAVQTYLEELLTEIITEYKPDGINLDYIRYPQSISSKHSGSDASSWGYTRYARADFKAIYDSDPIDLIQFEPLWEQWNQYRRDKITSFVRKASVICRQHNVNLTAVIFPNIDSALDMKQQDWRSWSYNNLVDGFTPLLLTCDPTTASGLMKEILNNKSDKTKLYAGLFVTFMNGAESDLIKQINELRSLELDGFSIFDYAHFGDKYVNPLTISICTPPKIEKIKTNEIQVSDTKSNEEQRKKAEDAKKLKYERRKFK